MNSDYSNLREELLAIKWQEKPVADPFIIACAKIKYGCVITAEALKPNAPKILTVCQHFPIDCTNVQGLMEREGWQFQN